MPKSLFDGAIAFDVGRVTIGDIVTRTGTDDTVVVGSGASIGVGCADSVAIGVGSTISDNATSAVAVGSSVSVGLGAASSIAIGELATVHDNNLECIVIGHFSRIGVSGSSGTNRNVIVGYDSYIEDGADDAVVVGTQSAVAARANRSLSLGRQAYVAADSVNSMAIGYGPIVGANSPNSCVIGNSSILGGGCNYSIIIGVGSVVSASTAENTLIGPVNFSGLNNHRGVLIGSNFTIGNDTVTRTQNIGIGGYSSIGRRDPSYAAGSIETADSSHFVDNDYITYPDGSGGTIDVEMKTTNGFVPTPGRLTADIRGLNAHDTAFAIDAVVLANTGLIGFSDFAFGIGWMRVYWYGTLIGPGGNGFQIVPHVANGASAAIGGTFAGGYPSSSMTDSAIIGWRSNVIGSGTNVQIFGSDNSIGYLTNYSIFIGDHITTDDTVNYVIALGSTQTIHGAVTNSILIGRATVVDASVDAAISIGRDSHVTGSFGIALGAAASAGASEAVVGNSTVTQGIHSFLVRGYNGGAINTLSAIDNPTAGLTGLSICYNDGATTSNKTLKAVDIGSLPVGAKVVYVE